MKKKISNALFIVAILSAGYWITRSVIQIIKITRLQNAGNPAQDQINTLNMFIVWLIGCIILSHISRAIDNEKV